MDFLTPQMVLKVISKVVQDDELYCIAIFVAATDVDRIEQIEQLRPIYVNATFNGGHFVVMFTKWLTFHSVN
jgi:hypothetical protein